MNYNLVAYFIYGLLSIFTIRYVGRVLHQNGRHFVLEIIPDESFCDFINNGLLAGYYLVNIGYVLFTLARWEMIGSLVDLLTTICVQTGGIYLMLGALHFINILALKLYARFYAIKT